jgi:hypothetical protein
MCRRGCERTTLQGRRRFAAGGRRTSTKLVQALTTESTINHDGTYVVPATIAIDGLSLTPTKVGRLHFVIRKFELPYFGSVAQWETFRRALTTNQLLCDEDKSISRQFLFYSRFSTANSGHVWMLIRGHINHLCGETPTHLRMGIPAPTTNFVGLTITLTKTQRKAASNSRYHSGHDARELEDWVEA